MAVAYLRNGLGEIEVYPSNAVPQGSFTLLLAGGYLFVVGVLAQIVARLGGAGSFQTQVFMVLSGTVALTVLLISDRFRLRVQRFVSRHFGRPQHDFRKTWMLMAQGMSGVLDQATLCTRATRLISETFNVLSVTTWLIDEQNRQMKLGASTSHSHSKGFGSDFALQECVLNGLRKLNGPFDLEKIEEDWAATLKEIGSPQFPEGGNRLCIPLLAGCRLLGVAILADRVSGYPYTLEELDLLKCIGNQVAGGLLNLRLADELVLSKQLEAFQTISTFFVHDLKNVVSSLSLTLQNLPAHFDDPEFREDALRGISTTVKRINHLIGRLGVLRSKLDLKPVESDLNEVVGEALKSLNWAGEVELVKELHPVPKISADTERLQSVVINLLLNAREAAGNGGQVRIQTSQRDGHAFLTVADNGCGMSPAFMRDSLYRPFHSTKKEGLGVGLYQSRMIIEAHKGSIQVESEPGKGTTFLVTLPLPREHSSVADSGQPCLARIANPELQTPKLGAPSPELRSPNSESTCRG
jgi:putative PEP-CTERM system histidine kinase